MITEEKIQFQKDEVFVKAINALAGYKFLMFGYWAAEWVKLNKWSTNKEHNPFKTIVRWAKDNR